ncbi:MAG: hypothetical protein WDM87_17670 [Terracidiphilus sp.]
MLGGTHHFKSGAWAHAIRCFLFALAALAISHQDSAQDTPLISGGVGFFTSTNAGSTNYLPITEPLLAAPIGQRVLVESRAALLESIAPIGGNQPGYGHSHFIGLTYLQGDFIASHNITAVAGYYLIPFNTYNDRLTPIWIGNFQDGPLILPLGLLSSGSRSGRDAAWQCHPTRQVFDRLQLFLFDPAPPMSNSALIAATGGSANLYLPEQRLELGLSYDRLLQGTHENFYGAHVWWEPRDTGFRLRSEFARGHHAQGYWIEADYRMKASGGADSVVGRLEPLFGSSRPSAATPSPATACRRKYAASDFGLDYNLPHNARILSSLCAAILIYRQSQCVGNRDRLSLPLSNLEGKSEMRSRHSSLAPCCWLQCRRSRLLHRTARRWPRQP